MIDAIKEVSCTRCLHQEVCKYKQDFLDICNKVKTTPITNLDCLGGIQIECRYYQMQAINPRLFDPGIYYSTLSKSATNVEDNKAGRVSDDVRF